MNKPEILGQVSRRALHQLYPEVLVMYDLIEEITLSVQRENISNRPTQVEVMAPFVAALTTATDSMTVVLTDTLQKGGAVTAEASAAFAASFAAIYAAQIDFCWNAEEKLLGVVHTEAEPVYQPNCQEEVIALLEFACTRIDKIHAFLGRENLAQRLVTDEEFVKKFIADSIAQDPKVTWTEGYSFVEKWAADIRYEIDREFACPPRLPGVALFAAPVSSS